MNKNEKIIFVYNANSGLFNTLTDIGHKVFSPSTYSCHLCELTHSYFSMRDEWSEFLKGLDYELVFLHKDELKNQYGIDDLPLPIILTETNQQLDILVDRASINACADINAIKELILKKILAKP